MACPICEKDTAPAYRPFCSRRCADVDLGRWLMAHYEVDYTERPHAPIFHLLALKYWGADQYPLLVQDGGKTKTAKARKISGAARDFDMSRLFREGEFLAALHPQDHKSRDKEGGMVRKEAAGR